MLRIAFASTDRIHVNSHFGGAESLVVFDVAPGLADLVGIREFTKAEQIGEQGRRGLSGTIEDKVLAKLDFLDGCSAVYAASIGTSSIRRLMAAGIQPIIVDNNHDIEDLLNEVSLALVHGGLSWVDRAKDRAKTRSPDRFDAIPPESRAADASRQLMTSIDEME